MKLGKTPCSECFFTKNHYFPEDFRDQMKEHLKQTYIPGDKGALGCHRDGTVCCRGFYDQIMLPALKLGDRYKVDEIVDLNLLPKPEARYITMTWRGNEFQYDLWNKEWVRKDTDIFAGTTC